MAIPAYVAVDYVCQRVELLIGMSLRSKQLFYALIGLSLRSKQLLYALGGLSLRSKQLFYALIGLSLRSSQLPQQSFRTNLRID